MENGAGKKTRMSIVEGRKVEHTQTGIEKYAAYETNALYWSTIGNEVLGAIILPLYGAFVVGRKTSAFRRYFW